MRKNPFPAFIFFLVLLTPFFSFCQTSDSTRRTRFEVGFTAGINASLLDRFGSYQVWAEDNQFHPFSLWGSAYGVYFHYSLLPYLQFKTGLQHAHYGGGFYLRYSTSTDPPAFFGKTEETEVWQNIREMYRMSYFEVPLLVRWMMAPKKRVSVYAEVGVSYMRLIKASFVMDRANPSAAVIIERMYPETITDWVNKNMWSYHFGGGLRFLPSSKVSVELGVRYSNSISRVFAYDLVEIRREGSHEVINAYDMVTHLHAFQLYLSTGYRF